jgi:hypothetical protein
MRIFGAFLIFLAVIYVWDDRYNNGRLYDGVRGMGRSMTHSMAR